MHFVLELRSQLYKNRVFRVTLKIRVKTTVKMINFIVSPCILILLLFFSSTTPCEFRLAQLFLSIASSLAPSVSSSSHPSSSHHSLILSLVVYYPSVRLSIIEHL
jgi:hypothetical protein